MKAISYAASVGEFSGRTRSKKMGKNMGKPWEKTWEMPQKKKKLRNSYEICWKSPSATQWLAECVSNVSNVSVSVEKPHDLDPM